MIFLLDTINNFIQAQVRLPVNHVVRHHSSSNTINNTLVYDFCSLLSAILQMCRWCTLPTWAQRGGAREPREQREQHFLVSRERRSDVASHQAAASVTPGTSDHVSVSVSPSQQ